MTNTVPSSASDSTWQAHDQEARLLGEILRTSRLALLFGEAGADKTALLKMGLMPLLRRRTSDRTAPTAREPGVVVPFPDRRRRASERAAKRRELIVYFDDWTDTPLAALHAGISRVAGTSPAGQTAPPMRLRETLATLSNRLDANFIILLDRFEEFLQVPSHREATAQFADELVEAINEAPLSANFLISLDEEARPRLASLRSRIPGFDSFSLRLTRPRRFNTAPAPVPIPAQIPGPPDTVALATTPMLSGSVALPDLGSAAPAPSTATAAAIRPRKVKLPPPRVPVKTEDVYAFIEATLALTARGPASEPFPVGRAGMNHGRAGAPAAQTSNPPPGASHPGGSGAAASTCTAATTAPAGALGSESPARTRGTNLDSIVTWLGRLLHPKSRPG